MCSNEAKIQWVSRGWLALAALRRSTLIQNNSNFCRFRLFHASHCPHRSKSIVYILYKLRKDTSTPYDCSNNMRRWITDHKTILWNSHVCVSQQWMTVRVTHPDDKFLHLVPRLMGVREQGQQCNAHAAPPYICWPTLRCYRWKTIVNNRAQMPEHSKMRIDEINSWIVNSLSYSDFSIPPITNCRYTPPNKFNVYVWDNLTFINIITTYISIW